MKKRIILFLLLVIVVLSVSLAVSVSAQSFPVQKVYDNFNDNSFDQALWINDSSADTNIKEINQKLNFTRFYSSRSNSNFDVTNFIHTSSNIKDEINFSVTSIRLIVSELGSAGHDQIIEVKMGNIILADQITSVNGGCSNTASFDDLTTGNYILELNDTSNKYDLFRDGSFLRTFSTISSEFNISIRHERCGGGGSNSDSDMEITISFIEEGFDSEPEVKLISPSDEIIILNDSIIFNASYNGVNSNSINATLFIWNSTSIIFNQTTNIVSGLINSTTFNVSSFSVGNYIWNVEVCNTTLCSFAITNKTFSHGVRINSETFNTITTETFSENFTLNITIGPTSSISSAILIHNNTVHTASINALGNDRIMSVSLTIPDVFATQNKTFNWQINVSHGGSITQVDTPEKQQIVNNLAIDGCLTNDVLILNYTIFDEDERTFLVNDTHNITANVFVKLTGDFSGEVFTFYSATVGKNPILICAESNLTESQPFRLDSQIQFTANNYVTEYHYIENLMITNQTIPVKVSLYGLLVSRSQEFLITYKDQNFIPISGALIEITREFLSLGQFLTVEISKTDNDGRTIGHFVLNDETYTLFVKKDGILLATFENVKAFCSNIATGDCRINLNELGSTSQATSFVNNLGINYLIVYNDTTKSYDITFNTIDGSVKTILINITQFDVFNTPICENSLVSSSGQLKCAIPTTFFNSTGLAKVYVDGELLATSIFDITLSKSNILSDSRWLLAFILIMSLPLLGITSGPMTIIFFLLGIITAGSLILLDLGGFIGPTSAFLWILIASLVLLWKANREGK